MYCYYVFICCFCFFENVPRNAAPLWANAEEEEKNSNTDSHRHTCTHHGTTQTYAAANNHRHRRLRDYIGWRHNVHLLTTFLCDVVAAAAAVSGCRFIEGHRNTRKKTDCCIQPKIYMRCSDRFDNFIVTISNWRRRTSWKSKNENKKK